MLGKYSSLLFSGTNPTVLVVVVEKVEVKVEVVLVETVVETVKEFVVLTVLVR